MAEPDLSPITHVVTLRCPPGAAFSAYAERIGEWWDPRYTADADTFTGVTIEPRVGGAVTEHHGDDGAGDIPWGEVVAYEPGRRLAYTSTLAQSREHPSLVSIDIEPAPDGSRVVFQHGGWDEANGADRRKFADWPVLLAGYTRLAEES